MLTKVKALVAQLVAILVTAIKTPRDDAAALAKLQADYGAVSAELAALKQKEAGEAAELAQDDSDTAALENTLQDALVQAAAASAPTDDHVVIAQQSLGTPEAPTGPVPSGTPAPAPSVEQGSPASTDAASASAPAPSTDAAPATGEAAPTDAAPAPAASDAPPVTI